MRSIRREARNDPKSFQRRRHYRCSMVRIPRASPGRSGVGKGWREYCGGRRGGISGIQALPAARRSRHHTDHNTARSLAAAINLDSISGRAPVSEQRITVYSRDMPLRSCGTRESLSRARRAGHDTALIRPSRRVSSSADIRSAAFKPALASDVPVDRASARRLPLRCCSHHIERLL